MLPITVSNEARHFAPRVVSLLCSLTHRHIYIALHTQWCVYSFWSRMPQNPTNTAYQMHLPTMTSTQRQRPQKKKNHIPHTGSFFLRTIFRIHCFYVNKIEMFAIIKISTNNHNSSVCSESENGHLYIIKSFYLHWATFMIPIRLACILFRYINVVWVCFELQFNCKLFRFVLFVFTSDEKNTHINMHNYAL